MEKAEKVQEAKLVELADRINDIRNVICQNIDNLTKLNDILMGSEPEVPGNCDVQIGSPGLIGLLEERIVALRTANSHMSDCITRLQNSGIIIKEEL